MSFHRNVYDLLDLLPEVCSRAERMIREHERKHGPLPAAVREWYCVDNVVPLTDRRPASSSFWYQYSNMDPPEPLSRVLHRTAKLDDRPAGRLVRVMGECQNVGDWRVEFDGTDDPPVWSHDPWHTDAGEEYWLAAKTFSDFVWNWIAEYHQFYKSQGPLPGQPHLDGHWAAGNLARPQLALARRLAKRFGEPEIREVGFGDRRLVFRAENGVIRLTFGRSNTPARSTALWVYAEEASGYRRLIRELAALGLAIKELRTSRHDYEGARNGRRAKR